MLAGTHEAQRDARPGLFPAERGVGPLLERDYWAVIRRSRLSPRQVGLLLATRFPELAPTEWVHFQREPDREGPLEVGERVAVNIRGAGECEVEVIHRSPQSLTLATVRGHPEAGRITFGAYRNERGDVVFHIRSRARASSRKNWLGYLGPGDPMQTGTWTDFVNRLAVCAGEGVLGFIRADTRRIPDEPAPFASANPTYLATGE